MEAAALIGIETTWCRDGADALLTVGANPPSALVIAAHTDTVSAARISAAVRSRWSLPILVGAAPGEEDLAREALDAGASAVIVRPYDIAAIAPFALNGNGKPPEESSLFVAGPIRVDRRGYETRVGDRYVELTQRELELLVFLIVHQGTVTSTEEISQAVWGHPARPIPLPCTSNGSARNSGPTPCTASTFAPCAGPDTGSPPPSAPSLRRFRRAWSPSA